MTLYEMTEQAKQLYELLNADEIDEGIVADTLEAMGVGDKLEDYCKVIRQFEADAEAYKAEKMRFEAKRKKAENAVARLEKRIAAYMQATAQKEIKCGLFDIKTSQSKAASIIDEQIIPAEYRKPQPDKIDVSGIRAALLKGAVIAGAELIINNNINIK